MDWQPTAAIKNLHLRAEILTKVRAFFAARNVLEVETPLLSHATVTDVYLQSFMTQYHPGHPLPPQSLYLQTSPEYAMKRLLAAGSGPIFQICKAFRNEGEFGRHHNPEFTMLEWYRPGFSHHDLMDETDELLQTILQLPTAERFTYTEVFTRYADINPHTISLAELKERTQKLGLFADGHFSDDKDQWLHLIMAEVIEPKIGRGRATFIYDFPTTQAALARIRPDNPPVAERFEVYIEGTELANGFHELTDASEQRQRFYNDLQKREKLNYSPVPMDNLFLTALEHGLTPCAGIALGIDRLVMLATKANSLAEVISFTVDRA